MRMDTRNIIRSIIKRNWNDFWRGCFLKSNEGCWRLILTYLALWMRDNCRWGHLWWRTLQELPRQELSHHAPLFCRRCCSEWRWTLSSPALLGTWLPPPVFLLFPCHQQHRPPSSDLSSWHHPEVFQWHHNHQHWPCCWCGCCCWWWLQQCQESLLSWPWWCTLVFDFPSVFATEDLQVWRVPRQTFRSSQELLFSKEEKK